MIQSQNQKVVPVINPAAITNNTSFTAAEVDTLGFAYATYYFYLGATDVALTALKLQETDTTGSGYADVSGAVFGTSTNSAGSTSTLPSATDDNKLFAIRVDLRGRKRFQKPTVTIGNGTTGGFVTAWAVLERAYEAPNTAAERGVSQDLIL